LPSELTATRQVRRHGDDPRTGQCLREIAIAHPIAREAMCQHGHSHGIEILRTINVDLDVLAAERGRFGRHGERRRLRDDDAGAEEAGCEHETANQVHPRRTAPMAKPLTRASSV
jgi:hypothetical protein